MKPKIMTWLEATIIMVSALAGALLTNKVFNKMEKNHANKNR